jgi:PAS domain S-box-containing protein
MGGSFDLIISDYLIPGFDGLSALAAARQQCPQIPFMFVSGAIQDEMAVECLKAGATDYVLKDRPARLVPAIRRALNEAEESFRRKHAEERLRQSEDQYRDLFENATDLIQSVTPEGSFLYVNRAWRQTLQYSETEVADLTIFDVLHPEYHERWKQWLEAGEREGGAGSREVNFPHEIWATSVRRRERRRSAYRWQVGCRPWNLP